MLRCLFTTNFLMLACNLFLYAVPLIRSDVVTNLWACKLRVVLLFFGLFSCNAVLLMAVER
jgi:hypothetical protein